jgi:glycosyltransferase involved in cell wall biosynthesis
VALNPSLADNLPGSVLEALASGVPVVSTNVGGLPYILKHEENALLVPPGDAQAMADAIHKILIHPEDSQKLVREGRKTVEGYAWSNVRQTLLDVYRDALGVKGNNLSI